ncbi:hypothetical protein EYC59_02725 [Candidatus Saccharibacteria bacterium]|nr:MAG: hypothetical protein EYC59_02725 [Candidatus Saccharibacteria bacterium]
MEDQDKNKGDALSQPTTEQDPSAPAVEGTPDAAKDDKPVKKPNPVKKFFKKVNLYLLLFILVVLIGGAVAVVSYLNSKKAPVEPSIANQSLSSDALKQLANSGATVGGTGQTLNVQGNAIFSGQVLIQSDLSVAGSVKVGKEFLVSSITVSDKSNLNDTQVNNLQVANGAVFQNSVTLQKDLNVGGTASFSGPVTMGQLTVSKLTVSGNGSLTVPGHISFPGASPARTIDPAPLGAGGTASISGSDTTGTVNISTGSGTVAGCFVKLRFSQAYANTPHVLISPFGMAGGQTQYYVTRSTTEFSICTANAAPTGQTFGFDYFITQ